MHIPPFLRIKIEQNPERFCSVKYCFTVIICNYYSLPLHIINHTLIYISLLSYNYFFSSKSLYFVKAFTTNGFKSAYCPCIFRCVILLSIAHKPLAKSYNYLLRLGYSASTSATLLQPPAHISNMSQFLHFSLLSIDSEINFTKPSLSKP